MRVATPWPRAHRGLGSLLVQMFEPYLNKVPARSSMVDQAALEVPFLDPNLWLFPSARQGAPSCLSHIRPTYFPLPSAFTPCRLEAKPELFYSTCLFPKNSLLLPWERCLGSICWTVCHCCPDSTPAAQGGTFSITMMSWDSGQPGNCSPKAPRCAGCQPGSPWIANQMHPALIYKATHSSLIPCLAFQDRLHPSILIFQSCG